MKFNANSKSARFINGIAIIWIALLLLKYVGVVSLSFWTICWASVVLMACVSLICMVTLFAVLTAIAAIALLFKVLA